MMDFDTAWGDLNVGGRVRVSDGTPPPPEGSRRFFLWRSHNFEGVLVEKIDGPPRALKIEMDKVEGARVAYTVAEWPAHTFEGV